MIKNIQHTIYFLLIVVRLSKSSKSLFVVSGDYKAKNVTSVFFCYEETYNAFRLFN